MVLAASTPSLEEPCLSGHDLALRWLLTLALVLQLASWWMQRGYPLADAVEFMDRAQAWVAGQPLGDGRSVRSFAFSILFVPPFAIARALGLEDQGAIVTVARLMQVGLALCLVQACARLAQRVAGRSAGLAVGFVVAINPLVLEFGVFPVSGIAAALCLALGLRRLIERGDKHDSWIGGLWLGLAFLMAYQSLLVALAVLLLLLARDRWAARHTWLLAGAGLAVCCLLQLLLDRGVYGRWDGSLYRYLLDNAGFTIARVVFDLGFRETAGALYEELTALRGMEVHDTHGNTEAMMRLGFSWYLRSAPEFFVWPVLGVFLVGAVHALLRPRWSSTLALLALVVALFVMGKKGSKSLRLCLPLLPLAVPLLALGWAWLAQRDPLRWLAKLALLAALPLSLLALSHASLRMHSAYWDAADWITQRTAVQPTSVSPRVSSAYDWAVFLRFPGRIEKLKLPIVLDTWDKLAAAERASAEQALDGLDWLILHQALLKAQPGLAAWLAPRFAVAAAFYDQDEAPELGAVLVLERLNEGGARLLQFAESAPTPQHARTLEFRNADSSPGLRLLGFDLQALPGSGWWWITYHWELPSTPTAFEVRDRITAPDGGNSWQNNHVLGRGAAAPSARARYLSEGYLFVPASTRTVETTSFRPLGAAYLRGDLIPASVWIAVRDPASQAMLKPWSGKAGQFMHKEFQSPDWAWSVAGDRLSRDQMAQAGGFFLPVHPRAALPR